MKYDQAVEDRCKKRLFVPMNDPCAMWPAIKKKEFASHKWQILAYLLKLHGTSILPHMQEGDP